MKAEAQFTASKLMGKVAFSGPTWSEEFPISMLPEKIAFYEKMADRYGHKTPSYENAMHALRRIA